MYFVPKLLIFYAPGARGDFLAAVLLNMIQHSYQNRTITIKHPGYFKMHTLHDESEKWPPQNGFKYYLTDIKQNNSIRISLNESDIERLCQLRDNKHILDATPQDVLIGNLLQQEKQMQLHNRDFKYLVEFSNLFDIEFLIKFYKQYNGVDMPAEYQEMITHNINLQ